MTTTTSIASLDLRTVPVYFLSAKSDLQKYVHRREVQKAALASADSISITTVYGTYNPLDMVTVCSLSHALLIEIALTRLQPFRPFLIPENDALPEDNISHWILHFPSNTDAVYPSMAADSADVVADVVADEYVYALDSTYISKPPTPIPGENLVRISTMLTAHACLVLPPSWALNWLR